ncbi:uncharacterized protein si:dkeyp-117h8.4 [Thalassophryne amazonica]|uniref:uncharacterized protein si:dkeyp-117h8.4 n=1 Tax=Thalassophryne amazonica TaxID=390379 RepID=UPI00147150BB|nr:uncharacterized protein si:dkeyp-117h8.4 [Thalassophryne amazonica]
MTLGKRTLSKMDSKFDFCQDGDADETSLSNSDGFVEEDGLSRTDGAPVTLQSLDESCRNLFVTDLQPEDQDEDLNATLRSGGSTLADLYPSMVSRIGKVWHRQHVSDAAESVLRRYRRWRQSSNRNNLNKTFDVLPGNSQRKRKVQPRLSATKSSEHTLKSPIRRATNLKAWQHHNQSPGRGRSQFTRGQYKPILVLDFSGPSTVPSVPETSKSKQIPLNEMFTVSQLSPHLPPQQEELPSKITVSPARFFSKMSQRVQKSESPVAVTQTTALNERSISHGSPVTQSPLKTGMTTREGLTESPLGLFRSPKSEFVGSCSREPTEPKSMPYFPSSPKQKLCMPPRRLYTPESDCSVRVHPCSSQPGKATSRHGLQRHHSFNDALLSSTPSYSANQLDDELTKIFHKFVCKNKLYSNNCTSCICAWSSEASRGHSSSVLAALSLSPHRSVLRKRQREVDHVFQPQTKHCRRETSIYSPGSSCHSKMVLRHHLLPSESKPTCEFCLCRRQSAFRMLECQQSSAVTQET